MIQIRATLIFAAFVLWLLALPMEGVLLHALGSQGYLPWFLGFHVGTLLLLGRFATERSFPLLARGGVAGTLLLTLALLAPRMPTSVWLAACGTTSATLAVLACRQLRLAPRPLLAIGAGLVTGNLAVLALQFLPLAPGGKIILLALLLAPLLLAPTATTATPPRWDLERYLPFIFVYYLISGLMYRFILPRYLQLELAPGGELIFYAAAVLAAGWLFRRKPDLLLAAGILCAMLGFTLIHDGGVRDINFGLFALQGGSGFIDFFLLALLVSGDGSLRSFGYALATQCGAILTGEWLSVGPRPTIDLLILSGNLVLTGAVLVLYFIDTRRPAPPSEAVPPTLADPIPNTLSGREATVLRGVLAGQTYREIADDLSISESSIKTYMRRIYEKTGTRSKRQLRQTILDP